MTVFWLVLKRSIAQIMYSWSFIFDQLPLPWSIFGTVFRGLWNTYLSFLKLICIHPFLFSIRNIKTVCFYQFGLEKRCQSLVTMTVTGQKRKIYCSKYLILKQWKKTFEEISKFSVNSSEGYFNILGFESKFPSLILSSVHEYWVSLNQLLYWTVQRFVFVRVRLLLGYINRFSKRVTI